MDKIQKEHIKIFAQKIKDKLRELKNSTAIECWICRTKTNQWICLIPENGTDDLGFGNNGEKMRIAFAPVCNEHDLNDTNVKAEILKMLKIRIQTLKN
jgi:hypothetical protein